MECGVVSVMLTSLVYQMRTERSEFEAAALNNGSERASKEGILNLTVGVMRLLVLDGEVDALIL
ncbi:unnamed protein product [Rhodiola kirilowii]